jgi:hypothetical protein
MDKPEQERLAELRAIKAKKKAELETKRHQEILESNKSVSDAVATLKEIVLEDRQKSTEALSKQLEELKTVANFTPAIEALEKALNAKVGEMAEAMSGMAVDNTDVIEALSGLAVTYEQNRFDPEMFSQLPKDYLPMRRVIRLSSGNYVFDDQPTSSGASIAAFGQPSSSNNGGTGDASAAKQDEQTGVLEQIAENTANITLQADDIDLNTDQIEEKLDIIASQQQQNGLTNDELRAFPVVVDDGHPDPQTDALTDDQLRAAPVPVSGTITLDEATLAALETITVMVSSGEIALDAATLAALENIVVSGTVELGATTLAALENITATVSGTVALDSATLTALENITATISGTVTVDTNLEEVLTDGTQLTRLKANGSVVDTENPLPIAGTFTDESGVPYSEANPLPVDVQNLTVEELNVAFPPSVVSTVNTTSTPLGADEVFTGEWEDVTQYSGITATLITDQASAVNGAKVQFSSDGIDIISEQAATVPPNIPLSFTFPPAAKYFRVIYTNGPIAQTVLEAQILYSYITPSENLMPIGSQTTDLYTATTTLSHLKVRTSTGEWVPLAAADDGKLQLDIVQPTTPDDTQPVSGTVALDSGTLSALETTTADRGSGWVDPQTNALTDAELRAAPVPVDTGLDQPTTPTDTQPIADVNKMDAILYRERLSASDTLTPSTGKRLKILKIQVIQSPDNSTANPITITMASQAHTENATGKIFDGWVGSDSTEVIGDVDEAATITAGNSNPVSVLINYKEI